MPLLHLRGLEKSYVSPDGERTPIIALRELALERKEQMALQGASGSGKSTLLHLIAGILAPDAGEIWIDGADMAALPEAARDSLRARAIGIIFQSFHLLPGYSALENVLLGSMFGRGADPERARELLARVGLGDRLRSRPRELSVGQQQRVAVARALANRPALLLADEPTGSLDRAHADEAIDLVREVAAECGAALLVASHDPAILARFPRVESMEALASSAARSSAR